MADAIAKFWVMPRTGTALSPVDSTSAGVTATKGFNLAADLIGGLPELEDQIGWTMVGTSGQARSERVATDVRDLQSFDVSFRNNRDPHAASPAKVGAGTVFSRRIIDSLDRHESPALGAQTHRRSFKMTKMAKMINMPRSNTRECSSLSGLSGLSGALGDGRSATRRPACSRGEDWTPAEPGPH